MNASQRFSPLYKLIRAGQLEEALQWLQSEAKPDARNWHERSRILCSMQRHDAALQAADCALELEPDNVDYLTERGTIYFHLRKYALAFMDFDRAVALAPQNPFPLACRAYLKEKLGHTQAAVEDYERALALDPEDAVLHNNLGLLLEKLGWEQKALAHFEKAYRKALESEIFFPAPPSSPPLEKNASETGSPHTLRSVLWGLITQPHMRREFWEFIRKGLRLRRRTS